MKKLKFQSIIMALCLVITAGFWSCNDEDVDNDGPMLEVLPSTLSFGDQVSTQTLTVKANREWTATFVESGIDWVSITPDKGSGEGTINVTVLANPGAERVANLKITSSINSATVRISQVAAGGSVIEGDALYQENCGSDVYKINTSTGARDDDNGRWPYIDQYTQYFNPAWEKGGTLDQSGVEYEGSNSNVSNSGALFAPPADGPFSGAPYVGMNKPSSVFEIKNINITGKTNFTFKFGAVFQENYIEGTGPILGAVTTNLFVLEVSLDGETWSTLTCSVAQQMESHWYMGVTEFKVPEGSTKLYIRYKTTNLAASNQGCRFDDFKLYEGGNGELIGQGGGDEPGDKTYITVAELRAKGEVTISDKLYVKASVISNKEGGNSTSRKNVVVSDEEAGIAIRFTADADFALGTELELALEGAQLSRYQGGVLQLNNFANDNATATGQTKIIAAKSVTAADLVTGKYESMYVAVPDVEVVVGDLNKKMVENGKHTNIGMEAKTSQTFSMFSAQYSVFKDDNVPQGSGILKGIVGVYIVEGNPLYQVSPQTTEDFAGLTGPRFGAEPTFSLGEPSFSGTDLKVGVEITDGKIVIPYYHAEGTESYNITVNISGDAANGITVNAVNPTLNSGSSNIEIPITGTPETVGEVTFTINGVDALTTNTVKTTVTRDMVDTLIYQTGFEESEGFTKSTTYNNVEPAASGPVDKQWKTVYGCPSTTSPIAGKQSLQMRWYATAADILGYTYTDFDLDNVTGIEVKTKNTNGLKVAISYSDDSGVTWKGEQVFKTGDISYILNAEGVAKARIRLQIVLPETAPEETSRLYIDTFKVYGK